MCKCGEDIAARWLLLLNGALFTTCPFSSGIVRGGVIALVFTLALRVADVWRSGYGFLGDLVAICLLLSICNALPFARRTVMWSWSADRVALQQGTGFAGKFRPMLFFCSTTHARFLPKKHSFKYPLLYVGIPVTFKGSIGGLFSVLDSKEERDGKMEVEGKEAQRPFTLFSLDPAWYTNPELPFEKKLDSVLIHHGIDPSLYPHIYLVTTPRFFGYSFNPVTYYYLYSAKQELKLVILEVLNTFGERHLYLLDADNPANPLPRKGYTFAGEMEKTFHISPFSHRSGSYSIQVRDPLALTPAESKLDMHIVTAARDGSKTMVARAFSVSSSFDMVTGGTWQGLVIAATWGYSTFLAVPWTIFEAWRLYRKKAVVYTRPEVLAGSGQRKATKSERVSQKLWLEYFQHRVSTYPHPISATVILPEPNAIRAPECVTFCNKLLIDSPQSASLTIRVSNPRFFTRYFSHQDPLQTIYLDIISQPHERRLADISNLPLFQDLLHPQPPPSSPPPVPPPPIQKPGPAHSILARLRRFKTSLEFSSLPPDDDSPPSLHPPSYTSTLDAFFGATAPSPYRRCAVRAVLIDLIAFGEADSLELYARVCGFLGVTSLMVGVKVGLATVLQGGGF